MVGVMGEVLILHQSAAMARRKSAKTRQVPAEDEKLLRRMRRVWRRPEDLLADIEIVRGDDDINIADRTLRAWWARENRISWAGGKLIERTIAYRLAETKAAARADEVELYQKPVAALHLVRS